MVHAHRPASPLNVLLAASEVVGFAKTGGLADVAGSLPTALARRGHHCAVILPLHRSARKAAVEPTEHTFSVPILDRMVPGRLWRSSLPGGVPVYLIEQDDYFDRDDPGVGRGIYQFMASDGTRRDYTDNCERFVFFNRAVLEVMPRLDVWPDVLHANDWQTGLLPVYLRELYDRRSDASAPYDRVRSLMTIHNMAFQGSFWHLDMPLAGLDWRLFTPEKVEFHNKLNFLKAGIVYADRINTVSPTYAQEIQTPYYGCGLQGVLYARRQRLSGIVNGVDYSAWDPKIDKHLAANYCPDDLAGKAECKRAVQEEMGLEQDAAAPLFGVVARLTEQKGVDLIGAVAPGLLDRGVQIAILGEGDRRYHQLFTVLAQRHPGRLGLKLGFSEPLAHRIEAGADLFLMPSAYEPSGLNQLYSLKYGTPPLVRATGGLADTVVDATPPAMADGTATGFRFAAYSAAALWQTSLRAEAMYRGDEAAWRQLMRNGMTRDWSWDRSAAEYEALYRALGT
jgi:starch synthase